MPSPRFSTFLFDLDGTLIDHFTAIHRSYVHTLQALGLRVPTPLEVRGAVGGGLENSLGRFVPAARLPEALKIYGEYWDRTMLDGVELLPGARPLLEMLRARGATLAVFTNKRGSSSRQICDHLGVTPFFQAVVGAYDTPWLKPEPAFMAHILGLLKAETSSALLIGDSPYDIDAAHNAAMPAWCVTTGTHNSDELRAAGADAIFPDLMALQRELEK